MRKFLEAIVETVHLLWRGIASKVREKLRVLGLAIVILLLPRYPFLDVEDNIYDVQMKAKYLLSERAASRGTGRIVIISVDDEARRRDISRRLVTMSPISRSYLADLITTIAEEEPRVIALDFSLDVPAPNASDDAALGSAIEKARRRGIPVIIASRLVESGGIRRPLMPLSVFMADGRGMTGHAHMKVSPVDEVVRQYHIGIRVLWEDELYLLSQQGIEDQQKDYYYLADDDKPGFYYWSFAAAIVLASGADVGEETLYDLRERGDLLIDFSLAAKQVLWRYSSWQVLTNQVTGVLNNKLVLVGADYEESYDRHRTPLSVYSLPIGQVWAVQPVLRRNMTGLEINGYAANTLLEVLQGTGGIVRISEAKGVICSIVLAMIVFSVGTTFLTHAGMIFVALIPAVLYVLLGIMLFQVENIYFPVVRPLGFYVLVGCVVYYVIQTGRSIRRKKMP